jgi:hypothetical protein
MDPSFDYDVFISFANEDQEIVRPLWQDLTASGLRVFWSDSTLRERVGSSWFEVIEKSLDQSRHLLLICTSTSLNSKWVRREYVAFLNHCHRPPSRLLVPALAPSVHPKDLPLFLRELEACSFVEEGFVNRLVRTFGGVDVAALLSKITKLDESLISLRDERQSLVSQLRELRQFQSQMDVELAGTREQLARVLSERNSLISQLQELREQSQTQTALQGELDRTTNELTQLRGRFESMVSAFTRLREEEAKGRRIDQQLEELYASQAAQSRSEISQNPTVQPSHTANLGLPLDFEATARILPLDEQTSSSSVGGPDYSDRLIAYIVVVLIIIGLLMAASH